MCWHIGSPLSNKHALVSKIPVVFARIFKKNLCGGNVQAFSKETCLDQNIVNLHMINCWIVENGGSTYPETKEDVLDATVCRWVAAPRREKGC